MDRNKKTLLQEIKRLLKGPVPDQTIIYFDGKYILGESLKNVNTQKEITQVQAKVILNDNPDCHVHCISLSVENIPEGMTDKEEIFNWKREHRIKSEIPDIIQSRICPPASMNISVTSRRCAESLVNLFSGIKDRPNPTHSKEY